MRTNPNQKNAKHVKKGKPKNKIKTPKHRGHHPKLETLSAPTSYLDIRNVVGGSGGKFVYVIVDHNSGFTYCRSLTTKDSESIKRHIMESLAHMERQAGTQLKIFRSTTAQNIAPSNCKPISREEV